MDKHRDLTGHFFKFSFNLKNWFRSLYTSPVSRLLCLVKDVKIGRNIVFNGLIIIYRYPHSQIIIGDNCLFNSAKKSLKEGLVRRCHLITLKSGAEIVIGKNCGVSGTNIVSCTSIRIGDNVLIGAHTTINDGDNHNTHPLKRRSKEFTSRPIVIEDNVFIGYNCYILKGVTIGKNSTIGANSVVISDIPPNSIALGNPCKVLMRRNWD